MTLRGLWSRLLALRLWYGLYALLMLLLILAWIYLLFALVLSF